MRSSSASSSVVARLDGERLEVGALDARAQHVVARGLSGALELLHLRERDSRARARLRVLQLGDARREQRLEVGALHVQRDVGALLALVVARRLAQRRSPARVADDEPAALEERLREVGVDGVGVRLVEHRAHGLAARTLVHVRVGAVEAAAAAARWRARAPNCASATSVCAAASPTSSLWRRAIATASSSERRSVSRAGVGAGRRRRRHERA